MYLEFTDCLSTSNGLTLYANVYTIEGVLVGGIDIYDKLSVAKIVPNVIKHDSFLGRKYNVEKLKLMPNKKYIYQGDIIFPYSTVSFIAKSTGINNETLLNPPRHKCTSVEYIDHDLLGKSGNFEITFEDGDVIKHIPQVGTEMHAILHRAAVTGIPPAKIIYKPYRGEKEIVRHLDDDYLKLDCMGSLVGKKLVDIFEMDDANHSIEKNVVQVCFMTDDGDCYLYGLFDEDNGKNAFVESYNRRHIDKMLNKTIFDIKSEPTKVDVGKDDVRTETITFGVGDDEIIELQFVQICEFNARHQHWMKLQHP